MAVGERALDPALEPRLEDLGEFGRPLGEIEDGAFFDLAVIALGAAQQDGGRRVPMGHDFDVHRHTQPTAT